MHCLVRQVGGFCEGKLMIKRTLAVVAVATAGILALLTGPASAQVPPATYQPNATQTLSATVVTPGQVITVSGTGCPANSKVSTRFDTTPVGSTVADSMGSYTERVTIPTNATVGTHTIVSTCGSVVLSSTITVRAASTGGTGGTTTGTTGTTGGTLPRTGANSRPLVNMGLGLLAVGGLFLVVARKKRSAATT